VKISELKKALEMFDEHSDIVVSILVRKKFVDIGNETGYDLVVNECRDIQVLDLTTEYYRCLRYAAEPIPIVAIRLENK